MTKEEAIEAIDQGKSITHSVFANGVYIKKIDANTYQYSDGELIHQATFWISMNEVSPSFRVVTIEDEIPPIPSPYILCAAVHVPNGGMYRDQPTNIKEGFVITGRRHSNCYQVLEMMRINIGSCKRENEGFLTSDNRYLNRYEAAILAKERGQILDNYTPEMLISENLYLP